MESTFFKNLRWDWKETDRPVIRLGHSIIFFKQRGNLGSFDSIWENAGFDRGIYEISDGLL